MFDMSKQPRLIYQGCATTWGVLARTQLTADGSCRTESRYIAGKKEDLVKYLKVLYDAKFSSSSFSNGENCLPTVSKLTTKIQIHPYLSLAPS